MKLGSIHRRRTTANHGRQSGYILIMILVMVAMLVIALTAAAPRIAQRIKREREIEMMHRGDQYSRAIKRYFKKFPGKYPASIDQLENTNNVRFLRKKYKDPMTADGVWKVVHLGEVQLAQGKGVNGLTPAAAAGNTPSSSFGPSANTGGTGSPSSATTSPGTGTAVTPGTGTAGTSSTTGSTSSTFGSPNGQTFGGGPILGVVSMSEAEGIHEFDGKKKYNEWMFIFDVSQDRGNLLQGPYNPKAFFGQSNIPGATGPGGPARQGTPTPGSNTTPQQPTGMTPPAATPQ